MRKLRKYERVQLGSFERSKEVTEVEVTEMLSRAYARLTSLQQLLTNNLRGGFVAEPYVSEYHSALGQLEEAGYDLDDFRIPSSAVKRRAISSNYLTGKIDYAVDREVEHGIFLMKLQAVLNYFSLVNPPSERRIGFAGPLRN
jgi:hypothetical protein